MAVKFKLQPNPTFRAKVEIPVHGGKAVAVEFEFKHRTRDQVAEFFKDTQRSDVDTILEVLAGWELDDQFCRDSVELLVQNYAGAAPAIVARYIEELIQARKGN